MHEGNPYKQPPDFASLADSYPLLKQHIFSTSTGVNAIDFKDPLAQRRLTEALLHRDFNISLTLPEGRLCPAIPNRLNYILWVQDIMKVSPAPTQHVTGIDIGTGASAIYPLLACTLEPTWMFVATEIDDVSRQSALSNIYKNKLAHRIQVIQATSPEHLLLPFTKLPDMLFEFTMCNPPFYSSTNEVRDSAEAKTYGPNAVCTGAEVEMITPGGESAFVRQMVTESLSYGSRCRWFTSMLGKLSSVADIVGMLRIHQVDNYGITELVQGQTRRWAVVWSFGDIRLPDPLARCLSDSLQGCLPLPNTLKQSYPAANSLSQLGSALQAVLAVLEGVYTRGQGEITPVSCDQEKVAAVSPVGILVFAAQNTWSRAARRKKRSDLQPDGSMLSSSRSPLNAPISTGLVGTSALECAITSFYVPSQQAAGISGDSGKGCWSLECSWVRGRDRALFESFWSHVSRKIGTTL